jgi:amino acid adenylation domain-containing protein
MTAQATTAETTTAEATTAEATTAEATTAEATTAEATTAELPLVMSQPGLWLVEQWAPEQPVYNIPTALTLTGRLDPTALIAAVRELGLRHEALRARFELRDDDMGGGDLGGGDLVQWIGPPAPVPVARRTLAGPPGGDRGRAIQAAVDEESRRRFDLRSGPLLRALLLDLGGQQWVLVLTVHHIVADGWAVGLLLRDLSELYAAKVDGRASPPAPVPGSYAAAVHRTAAAAGSRDLEYWRGQLDGVPALDLPVSRPAGTVPDYAGRTISRALPAPVGEQVAALAREQRCTPFLVTLAGFAALLHRISGQDRFLLGTAINRRTSTELERVVGLFINMAALRVDLAPDGDGDGDRDRDGGPTFRELLRRLRGTVADAADHAALPFDQLVRQWGGSREGGRNPLFQIAFNYQAEIGAALELAGVTVRPVPTELGVARFDLNIVVTTGEDGLRVEAEYATDRFDADTIERLLAQYETLLASVLAEPDQPVSRARLLPDEERSVLRRWGSPGAEYPVTETLDQLVAEQARQRPDAPAVSGEHDDDALTYRELDERANVLARRLQALGVRPGDRVGVCLEREPVLVVALLAVLKAGGAYLPMDPAYPPERLRLLCDDARPVALLTAAPLHGRLPEGVPAICVDEPATAAGRDALPPAQQAPASSPAYVIYTSGSTGRPKGVQVSHANVVRLFRATEPWFGFGPDDVWTCFHSAAFDFSVWEIWGALVFGGEIVLVPGDVARDPVAFRDLLARRRVTVLSQTPAAFRQLIQVETVRPEPPDLALRTVVFGGEALDYGSLRPWLDRYGDQRPALVNMYGITETTVHVTYRPVRAADVPDPRGPQSGGPQSGGPQSGALSPIGVPIPDLSARVVDRYGNEQPIGVVGELFVGGAGVAIGYLNRPELTAERFGADLLGPGVGGGERFYRTGDLAAWLPSGELDYRGRADQQIKVRGYRIEPGEIQAAIGDCPGVRESFVTAVEADGDRRLVAYVAADPPPPAEELRHHLEQRLPAHMIPQSMVFLPRLPLTGNGKVDRARLPGPDAHRAVPARHVAPRSDVERLVAGIVAEVVGVPVGVHDDFFTVGGTSLDMTRVLALLRRRTGVQLTARDFFRTPTVAGLAAALGSRERLTAAVTRPPRVGRGELIPLRGGTGTPLFCLHPSGGSPLCYLKLAATLSGRYPMVGVQAVGLDGRSAPLATVEEMAAHYGDLIEADCPTGPVDLLGWSYGGVAAFETARELQRRGRRTRVVLLDAPAPEPAPEPARADLLMQFAGDIAAMTGTRLPDELGSDDLSVEALARLGPEAQVAAVHEALCRCGATTAETELSQIAARAEVFIANLRALARYRPDGTYDEPLLVIRAQESLDLSWAWSAWSAAGVVDAVVPGDHYSLVDQQISTTAAQIDSWLDSQIPVR